MALNQAAGLHALAGPSGAQLITLVSHGDHKTELPILWQMCSALTGMGYSVAVLDGTQAETTLHPGLLELLDYRFGFAADDTDAAGWTTIPSALGLQNLLTLGSNRALHLARICQPFRPGSVLILYAGADTIVKLLPAGQCEPILCVSAEKNSLLTSYLALKRLLLKGGMEPLVLNVGAGKRDNGRQAVKAAMNLSDCAKNFLGYELKAIPINTSPDKSLHSADLRLLVLRMLDSAIHMENTPFAGTGHRMGQTNQQVGRSH